MKSRKSNVVFLSLNALIQKQNVFFWGGICFFLGGILEVFGEYLGILLGGLHQRKLYEEALHIVLKTFKNPLRSLC